MSNNSWYEFDVKLKDGWNCNSTTYRTFKKAREHQDFLFKEFGMGTRIRCLRLSTSNNGIVEYYTNIKGV
tara:strand:+ start:302 stop:511 length:210 start_codon:yes stop_codon:yes gene_type:complete